SNVPVHQTDQTGEPGDRGRHLRVHARGARRHLVRRGAEAWVRLSGNARRVGIRKVAPALDAARGRHSMGGSHYPPPRPRLRAGAQRVLSDGDRPPPYRRAPRDPAQRRSLAISARTLRGAVRAAAAASADAIPASRDDRVLTNAFPPWRSEASISSPLA